MQLYAEEHLFYPHGGPFNLAATNFYADDPFTPAPPHDMYAMDPPPPAALNPSNEKYQEQFEYANWQPQRRREATRDERLEMHILYYKVG